MVRFDVRPVMSKGRHVAEVRVRHFMVMYSMAIVDRRQLLLGKLPFHRIQLLLYQLNSTIILADVQDAVLVDFAARRPSPFQIRIRIHNGAFLWFRMLVVGGRVFDSSMQVGNQVFVA